MDIIRAHPPRAVVEFDQPDVDILILRLVNPQGKSPIDNRSSFNKRYAIVTHHGTNWTSVPKIWLRDRGAKAGDVLEVFRHAHDTALVLKLTRPT